MADEVLNLLLRVTGDSDDAERDLDDLGRELSRFDSREAEAEVNVDTDDAHADLEALRRDLDSLDAKVDVDRGSVGVLDELVDALSQLGTAGGSAGGGADAARVSLGGLSGAFGPVAVAALALASVIVTSLVAALATMAASLTLAVGALGAMAVAMGGALAAAVAFGAGMALALKRGGPTAQALKAELMVLKDAFIESVTPGVQAFARELAPAMNVVSGALEHLQGGFLAFGQSAGAAVRLIAKTFDRLGPSINDLIGGVANLIVPFTQVFLSLGEILLNIANAAMPLLTEGARAFAKWLGEIASKSGDIGGLRGFFEDMVGHLRSWLRLIGAVGEVFAAFVGVAAGQGKGVVDTLAEGALKLAEWIRNNPEAIRKFFTDTLPLAGEFLRTLGQGVVLFLQLVQTVAPALTVVFATLAGGLAIINSVVTAVSGLVQTFLTLAATLGPLLAVLSGALAIFAGFPGALAAIWEAIKVAASAAWNAIYQTIIGPALNVIGTVLGAWAGAVGTIAGIWSGLVGLAAGLWGTIAASIVSAVSGAISAVAGLAGQAFAAGASIVSQLAAGLLSQLGAIKDAAGSILDAVKGAIPLVNSPLEPAWLRKGLYAAGQEMPALIARGARTMESNLVSSLQASVATPSLAAAASTPAVNVAGMGGGGTHIDKLILPEPPGGGNPDARTAAVQLARELARRGG